MKQIFAACAAVVLVMGVTAPIHAGTPFSLKHKGVDCAACHKTQSPAQPAAQDACIGCHGQYKGKPVPNADYNPDRNPRRPVVEVNPHDSHLAMSAARSATKNIKPVLKRRAMNATKTSF